MSSEYFVVGGNDLSAGLRAAGKNDGLVTVIVACSGQLEYTRLCVPSLLRFSRQPFELLFLDCDSLDGTAEYLEGLAAAAPVRVEVARVPAEPPPGSSRPDDVISIRGQFVALLDNDTIVTQNWLERLIGLASSAPDIGMVAPMSNHASPSLQVDPVPYGIDLDDDGRDPETPAEGNGHTLGRGLAGPGVALLTAPQRGSRKMNPWPQIDRVNRFAQKMHEQFQGIWFEAESLAGGCVLLKREVLQKLGLFPSRTPLGTFDTESLSLRVRQVGYRLAGSNEVFIHHFGSRSAFSRV